MRERGRKHSDFSLALFIKHPQIAYGNSRSEVYSVAFAFSFERKTGSLNKSKSNYNGECVVVSIRF